MSEQQWTPERASNARNTIEAVRRLAVIDPLNGHQKGYMLMRLLALAEDALDTIENQCAELKAAKEVVREAREYRRSIDSDLRRHIARGRFRLFSAVVNYDAVRNQRATSGEGDSDE